MIDIDFDSAVLDAAASGLDGTEAQVKAARARALKKTIVHFRTLVKREVSKKERIPQKAIGNRFFISPVAPDDDEASLWMGTADVSPFAIGDPSQNKTGVRVGRRSYRGAFLGTIYTAKEKVWIRLRSKHYDPELYPTKKQHHAGYSGGLSASQLSRFPVIKASIPIDGTVRDVAEKHGDNLGEVFSKNFSRELKYELFFKGM